MLNGVDPLVQRIDALPKRGSFAVTLVLADGQEQIVVVAVDADGVAVLPAANIPSGWSAESKSAKSLLTAVAAFHEARTIASSGRPRLLDIDGGWDVSIGNVLLGADGQPECVADGPMTRRGEQFVCEECGAAAIFATD
jgi:hypothetical protein